MEVVIAMIILITSFGIGMVIFVNVTRSTSPAKRIRAEAAIEEILNQAQFSKEPELNSTFTKGEFRITEVTEPYQNENNLFQLHLTVYDQNGIKIMELKKVYGKNDTRP